MKTARALALTLALTSALGGLAITSWPALAADGYLTAETLPDATRIVPPPPAPGTGVAADDKAAFFSSRKLKDTPRWEMATRDAAESPEASFIHFACALGVTLDDGTAPALSNLLNRVHKDESAITDPPKEHFGVRRPYVDLPGDICTERNPDKSPSLSYPSGHTTLGWATGLILTELAPDRATEILSRARVYGESRVACGVHYPSDIEAGRTNGAALVAALHGNPEFRADLERARGEVAAARKKGSAYMPDPSQCKLEKDAAAQRPW